MSVDLSKMSVEEMDDWIGAASTPDLETDRLSTCYNELARRHAEVTAERDELRKMVAKLPKTADGVPVRRGMRAWLWTPSISGGCPIEGDITGIYRDKVYWNYVLYDLSMIYSTREAAEAARCGGEVGNG